MLSEGWRRVSEVHEQHTDTSTGNLHGYDHISGFGPVGSSPALYVFDGPTGENSLALQPPGYHHCGTGDAGWLSGWTGSAEDMQYGVRAGAGDGPNGAHTTGGPPRQYAEPFPVERLPRVGDPPLSAVVCFNGCRDSSCHCGNAVAIRVVNCGDHFVWELPPVPIESLGYYSARI